jgi:predicted DNA-binding WGR domain protein
MIFLRRTDPTKNIDRFYVVSLIPTLLGEWTLLREWGRRGSPGTVRRQSFANADEAEKAVQRVIRRLLRHGYEQAAGFAPEPKVAAKPDGIKGDA